MPLPFAATTPIVALVMIVFGLFICFFGYAYWRVMLAIAGLTIGALIGMDIAGDQPTLGLIIGAVLGVVGFLLAYSLWSLAVLIIGAVMGAGVGSTIAALPSVAPLATDNSALTIILVVIGVVVGVLIAALVKDIFVVYATAFGGAGLAVRGLALLLPSTLNINILSDINNPTVATLLTITLWIALGIVGMLYQLRRFTRRSGYALA